MWFVTCGSLSVRSINLLNQKWLLTALGICLRLSLRFARNSTRRGFPRGTREPEPSLGQKMSSLHPSSLLILIENITSSPVVSNNNYGNVMIFRHHPGSIKWWREKSGPNGYPIISKYEKFSSRWHERGIPATLVSGFIPLISFRPFSNLRW